MAQKGIPIYVRLRRDSQIAEWTAQDWLGRLQTGFAGLLVEQVEVYGQPMNVALTYTPDRETLILASNTGAVTAPFRRRIESASESSACFAPSKVRPSKWRARI